MSATVSPPGVVKILTGRSSWIRWTAGPAGAMRGSLPAAATFTAGHAWSSKPAAAHPGFSSRAS
jgi:hypothetical protein